MLQIEIIGHLGNDAVVKDFNGKKYISFNVAHSDKYKDAQGNQVEKTTWVSCLKSGESKVLEYLKKGAPVFVRGDLSTKLYNDATRGTQVSVNCLVHELQLLPRTRQDGQQPAAAQPTQPGTGQQPGQQPGQGYTPPVQQDMSSQRPAPTAWEQEKDDLPF